ncbi:hypothetical protein [Escherichia coli]|uniref:hypothetical protein n=1 Tax=Escherichia coli TaxID=562 RepID=UPI001CA6B423|nr:hypothetical protein [Escherichia coli]QZY67696.1 hypothetical protein K7X33_16510 [Escherichia coli]
MSDDYEQYALWEERLSNAKAGRAETGSPKPFNEYLAAPAYKGDGEPYQPKPKPTIYTDERGKQFIMVDGVRDYLED